MANESNEKKAEGKVRPFLRWDCLETIEEGKAMKDMILQFILLWRHAPPECILTN